MSANATTIQLKSGEKEEIVTDDQAKSGIPYLVQIEGENGVRYAHNRRNTNRGLKLSANQTHQLSNFRGSGIYVEATDGPTSLVVRPAGADLTQQPPKQVEIDGDVNVNTLDVSDDRTREIGKTRIKTKSGALVDSSNRLPVDTNINSVVAKTPQNPNSIHVDSLQPSSSGDDFPSQGVPDGKEVVFLADENNSSSISVNGKFPLYAGASISLKISNLDVPTFAGQNQDELYAIVEV